MVSRTLTPKITYCAAVALFAVSLGISGGTPGSAQAQNLAYNPLVLQTRLSVADAARLSEPPNQYLATAVIQQIGENPGQLETIISAAVNAQPASKDFVVRRASNAYPVFADRIAAAAARPAAPPPPVAAPAPVRVAQAPARAAPPRRSAPVEPFESRQKAWYDGWYIDAAAGLNILLDSSLDDPALGTREGTLSSDPGFAGSFALGTGLGKNFRVEAELAYRTNDPDSISVGGFGFTSNQSVSGSVTVWSGMVNGYYDIHTFDSFVPYVGIGAGFASVSVDISTNSFEESDLVFAYQAALGIRYPLSDQNIELRGGYRFFNALSPELGTTEAEYFAHTIEAGLTYHF